MDFFIYIFHNLSEVYSSKTTALRASLTPNTEVYFLTRQFSRILRDFAYIRHCPMHCSPFTLMKPTKAKPVSENYSAHILFNLLTLFIQYSLLVLVFIHL
jgi:hypothetical protein